MGLPLIGLFVALAGCLCVAICIAGCRLSGAAERRRELTRVELGDGADDALGTDAHLFI